MHSISSQKIQWGTGDLKTGLAFWHCAHSMQRRVYKTVRCPSVRLSVSQSVPSVERSSGVRRICCWAPYAQKISINSAGRPAAAAPQPGSAARRSAANAGNVMLTAELTRLNTDLGYFLFWAYFSSVYCLCGICVRMTTCTKLYMDTLYIDWTWMDRRTKISRISSWKIWQP